MAKNKALEIDMCAGSELRDSQGETLSIEGADITDMECGRGRFCDNHGKGFWNSLGRITEAKKIFKVEDCETDRHTYYWEQIKAPYIYVRGLLYNDEDHPNAKAAAAILRNIHKSDCPLKLKASVEGGVVSRGIKDPTRLERTKIHSIALTFTPANKATLVEPINLTKSLDPNQEAVDQELIKSVMHLAQDNVPSFRYVQRNAQASKIINNIEKIQALAKATGLNITIQNTDPEKLIKSAIEAKVLSNIKQINKLMKQFNGAALTAHVQQKRKGNFDFNADAHVTTKPTISLNEHGHNERDAKIFQSHATRLHKDPRYADKLKSRLVESGASKDRAHKILGHVGKYLGGLKKGCDVEKGELKNIVTGLVGAATLAVGAGNIGKTPTTTPKSVKKDPAPQAKVIPHHEKEIQWDERKGIDPKGKFRKPTIKEQIARIKEKKGKKVKKALTAGYGGAGVPTNATGGAVMQPESLEDANKKMNKEEGFKYIICKGCGKEQVYGKNQVKCRECKQNFSLQDLFKLIAR